MASKEGNFPGPRCKNANISVEELMDGDVCKLNRDDFSKGILHELNQYRKVNNINWEDFYGWIQALTEEKVPKLATLKVTLARLDKACVKLTRNKEHDKLQQLMDESALVTCTEEKRGYSCKVMNPIPIVTEPSSYELKTLQKVNIDLAGELKESEAALNDEKMKTDELSAKLSKLSIRNVNKKLKRRDNKIKESQCCMENLTKEIESKSVTIAKLENKLESAQQGKECYRSKLNRCLKASSTSQTAYDEIQCQLVALKEECQLKIDCLENQVVELRSEMQTLKVEYKEMQIKVEDGKIETQVHSQLYTDNVRQCCLELLSMNVGILQVDPIIRSVLKNIAGMEVDKLPKPASLVRMLTELKCLAYQQIADELQECENITLHSDGTSKFGQHYGSFQISTDTTAYSLGLSQMLTGSAQQTLDVFKQILSDFQQTVGSQAKAKLVTGIKNTMSDRHIVQKNFNCLLEEYRALILPEVITSWHDLSSEEQQSMSSLNNFFCGLHLLIGMADTAASTLLQWEATHFSEDPVWP